MKRAISLSREDKNLLYVGSQPTFQYSPEIQGIVLLNRLVTAALWALELKFMLIFFYCVLQSFMTFIAPARCGHETTRAEGAQSLTWLQTWIWGLLFPQKYEVLY